MNKHFGIIIISFLFISSCAMTSAVDNYANSDNRRFIYIEKFINGIVKENGEVTLCLKGSVEDPHSHRYAPPYRSIDSKYKIPKIETYTFKAIYVPIKGRMFNWYATSSKNISSNCNDMPSGNAIKNIDNFTISEKSKDNIGKTIFTKIEASKHAPRDRQLEGYKDLYESPNYIIAELYSISNSGQHTKYIIVNQYNNDLPVRKLAYIITPFTFILDVITFPIQIFTVNWVH